MKKLLSLFLCASVLLLSLVGCKTKEVTQKDTDRQNFTPTKLNISALYDSTACSLSYLMELNTQSNLKGIYAISLYKDADTFLKSNEFSFGLALTTLSSGIELCQDKNYARMLSLISCGIDAFSKNELKNIKDFKGKKVLVFNDSDLEINLDVMLKKAKIQCNITTESDSSAFLEGIKNGKYDIAVAAYPTASEITVANKAFKHRLSLNDQWDKLKLKGKPYSHCIVASSEIITDEFGTCELFFEEFNTSINKMNSADNTAVQAIANRAINYSADTALITCKQNLFVVEDYTYTQKLLAEYTKARKFGNNPLPSDHIQFAF